MPVIQWKLNGNVVIGKGSNEKTGARLVVSVRLGALVWRIYTTPVSSLGFNFGAAILLLWINNIPVSRLEDSFPAVSFLRIDTASVSRLDVSFSVTSFVRIDATSVLRLDVSFAVT